MRLFLAIKLDRPAEAQLARRLLELQRALGDTADALRWTPAANIHATLHFLGEIDVSRLEALREALGTRVAEPSFEMSLGGAGVFPASGAPRVVWLAVMKGAESVANIHREMGERLTRSRFAVEKRAFSPHVTVARIRDRESRRTKHLRERLAVVDAAPIAWIVECVTLFRSDLSGAVPRYEAAHEIRLSNSTDGSASRP